MFSGVFGSGRKESGVGVYGFDAECGVYAAREWVGGCAAVLDVLVGREEAVCQALHVTAIFDTTGVW